MTSYHSITLEFTELVTAWLGAWFHKPVAMSLTETPEFMGMRVRSYPNSVVQWWIIWSPGLKGRRRRQGILMPRQSWRLEDPRWTRALGWLWLRVSWRTTKNQWRQCWRTGWFWRGGRRGRLGGNSGDTGSSGDAGDSGLGRTSWDAGDSELGIFRWNQRKLKRHRRLRR